MFLCTRGHRNLIIFPAVLQTQALHFHLRSQWRGVGWGWDSSCFCAHAGTATLIIFPAVLQTQALHFHLRSLWRRVGWDKNVSVPVHRGLPSLQDETSIPELDFDIFPNWNQRQTSETADMIMMVMMIMMIMMILILVIMEIMMIMVIMVIMMMGAQARKKGGCQASESWAVQASARPQQTATGPELWMKKVLRKSKLFW